LTLIGDIADSIVFLGRKTAVHLYSYELTGGATPVRSG